MKVVNKMALSLIIVLALTAAYSYAQDANEAPPPPPPSQQQTEQPAPPPEPRYTFDDSYIAQLLEKLKADDSNEAQRIEGLRQSNPGLFQIEIRKLAAQYRMPGGDAEQGPMHRRGPGQDMIRDRFRNMETELMSWLEKNEPQTAKELAALKEKDPRAYMRRLSIETRKYREIIDAQQTNPALAELLKKDLVLKQKRNELLEQYKAATDEKQKKELMTQLKDVTSERFDLILQKKELKYEELKKKLEELQNSVKNSQAELENYKKNKDELTKKHLDDLIKQSNQFDWD